MLITEKWLEQNIVQTKKGYQLSQKQFEYLFLWFKDEIFTTDEKGNKNLKKKWQSLLVGKELNDTKAKLFVDAKYTELSSKKLASRFIKNHIERAKQNCAVLYNGKVPEHPQDRLVALVGHTPDVDLINVIYYPDGSTIIDFFFDAATDKKNRHMAVVRNGVPLTLEPPTFQTDLFAIIPPVIAGEEEDRKHLLDCTGKDIVECINRYKKKKIIFKKKTPEVVTFKSSPEDMFTKTSKQKEKDYKKTVKTAKKLGITIQPRTDFERIRDGFIDDFNELNKKLEKQNKSTVTLQEFANMANVNLDDMTTLLHYEPGKIDWSKTIK